MSCPPAPSLSQPGSIVEAALEGGGTPPVRHYGNPDGPRLLMSHGDGLAIDLYYPSWSLLLDDFDVIVFDLRNHGANLRAIWRGTPSRPSAVIWRPLAKQWTAPSEYGRERASTTPFPARTHLAQLEKPPECVRLALEFLGRSGFSPR